MTEPTTAGRAPSDAPTGRRELNKARTREAVASSLRTLLVRHPVADITVDQVAEGAGISRRTFFNYYGGIAAVLADVMRGHTTHLVEGLQTDPLGEDPVASLRRVLRDRGLSAEFLTWMAALNCHGSTSETAVLVERAVWTDLGDWFRGLLVEALPAEVDPVYVATLADAVMSAFAAAEQPWLARLDGRVDLTAEDVTAFLEHLDRALGYVADGWALPTAPGP
ncbi:TetR/AcrR family transcriptional regulator [Ornithinimicrobium sp. W1679]|uniref:TetR/AcrR family transcriptional regulator n=1 Tax=Ornithinimicrobium sp. W1679 TaxID=3418770 RepID=UPI003CE6E96E